MENPHVKPLAEYQTNGAVYCYGYGAVRQLVKQYDEGLVNLDHYFEQVKNVVSAVEFRVAEIWATFVMETSAAEQHVTSVLDAQQVKRANTVELVVDNADGIARDQ